MKEKKNIKRLVRRSPSVLLKAQSRSVMKNGRKVASFNFVTSFRKDAVTCFSRFLIACC